MTAVLLANAIAADAGLIPGLAIFGPALGLPLSVLAAFIERPFVTRAGVGRNAIWFSLQANFVSLLFGYFATMVVVPFIMSPGGAVIALAWPFAAVGISVVTEHRYLAMRLRPAGVARAPIAWGNMLSAVTCIAVMVGAGLSRDAAPQLSVSLRQYETAMNIGVGVASLLLLVGSFVVQPPHHAASSTSDASPAIEPVADQH
jgi:hypothetical protein